MIPQIVQVVPTDEYKVYVYFEDGKIVLYDVSRLLEKEVFKPLRDKKFFMSKCVILNDTLAWDVSGDMDPTRCIDIDPDTLYSLEAVEDYVA